MYSCLSPKASEKVLSFSLSLGRGWGEGLSIQPPRLRLSSPALLPGGRVKLLAHTQTRTRRVAQDELSRIGSLGIAARAKCSSDRQEISFVAPGIFDDFLTHAAM